MGVGAADGTRPHTGDFGGAADSLRRLAISGEGHPAIIAGLPVPILRHPTAGAIPIAPMAKVEIYTWRFCPFCIRAKALLDRKGVAYSEYAIDGDEQARAAMAERAGGGRSLPQIFIDGRHVGGCDDLHALERRGQLDPLLAA